MSNRNRTSYLICLVLGLLAFAIPLAGCATTQVHETAVYPTVPEGKALVYFYREKSMVGAAIRFHVSEGETPIGVLKNGVYFFSEAAPGSHVYWAKTESRDEITLVVEAGQTYYVRGSLEFGVFVGRPRLTGVSEQEGAPAIKKLRYATLPPEKKE